MFAYVLDRRSTHMQCFCGVVGDDPDALGEATCNMACAGDLSETCGGRNALSVYTNDSIGVESSTDDGDAATITDDTNSDATSRGCWTDVSSDRLFRTMGASDVGMTTQVFLLQQ